MPQRLSLPYHRQKAEGYCLAACAQMVLHYWGFLTEQNQLAEQMDVIPDIGVPASRITRLASREITPIYDIGEWELLIAWLDRRVPVIAMVQAGEFAHWWGNACRRHRRAGAGIRHARDRVCSRRRHPAGI